MGETVPVLFDTDIGTDIDDSVCLAYLLAEPRCRLLGISTATGEAGKRAMLADAVCRAAGRSDVPIWSGADTPLLVEQKQKTAQQAEALARCEHREDFPPNEAVEMLRRTIREHPGEITLLTVGPLTNIGLLFALDREVPRLLKRMVMMVGSFFEEQRPEWNAAGDPHATAIVFSSEAPEIQVHGLDVSTKCRLPAEECRARFHGGPLDVVAEMAEVWFRNRDKITFHDPLAAACIFEPDICTYRRGRVSVELGDEPQLGRTDLEESAGGAHLVADGVDAERFFERYFSVVEKFQ